MNAEEVKAKADHAVIAQYLANILPADQIGPRPEGSIDFRTGRIPTKPKAYRAWLVKHLDSHTHALERDRGIYEDHRTGGLDMLTDVAVLHASGDATQAARSALETIFYLKSAHISANLCCLIDIRRELERVDGEKLQENASSNVPAVPNGYEFVDVLLPAHQAFIVKKWAETAQARLNSKGKK